MEILVGTIRGLQETGDRGLDLLAGAPVGAPGPQPEAPPSTRPPLREPATDSDTRIAESTIATQIKEKNAMDRDLHDDMLKLVRYKILFVKREYEYAFPEEEDLVSDNLDAMAFTAWKVAEFIQKLEAKDSTIRIPAKWGTYPTEIYRRGGFLRGFPEEDKKYLRVYFEVLDRYSREKFKYEEQQIRVLEQIRDTLRPLDDGTTNQ